MKRININNLSGSEVLAVPVVSESDVILIQSDTILRSDYIERLRELDVEYVYVKSTEDPSTKKYKVDETTAKSKEIVQKIFERHIYKHNEELKKVGEAAQKILDSVIEDPEVISNVTEIRNISTDMYSHCINVCTLATIMAVRLKMSEKQIRNVAVGAILHDIGLRYIQEPYMNINLENMSYKDSIEYKKHTIYGYSSIEKENWLSETAKEIILFHHERVDGSGYPFHHKGNNLKMEVKLVSVCSDFDSLISGVGAEKLKLYQAIEYIKVHAGIFYNELIANKLLEWVAVYPIGCNVITNEGEIGVVVGQNKEMTDRPIIKMLQYADGRKYNQEVIKDLRKLLTLFIVDTE